MNELSITDSIAREYIVNEGLDRLVHTPDAVASTEAQCATSDAVIAPIAPSWPDLVRLHKLIRARKAVTVLEFGVGFSTPVIADALAKNQRESLASPPVRRIRGASAFHVFSVDASKHWIEEVRKRLPAELLDRVHLQYSEVTVTTHEGQLCHRYEALPDIVPDFVYLDGPSPTDVQGSVSGLTFRCPDRTVMAADLLLMEPTFLPGMFILVDGRTNNARFLARSFRRKYEVVWHRQADVTTFELIEEPLFGGCS